MRGENYLDYKAIMKTTQARDKENARAALIGALPRLIRKEIRSAMLFVHSVAESVGMHPTDIQCVDFLVEAGSATAGDLARVTGLTTGAVTAVIDRMERAGFVKRTRDKQDGRKVIVTLVGRPANRLQATRELFARRIPLLLDEYTDEELGVISRWNEKITLLLQCETKRMKEGTKNNQ